MNAVLISDYCDTCHTYTDQELNTAAQEVICTDCDVTTHVAAMYVLQMLVDCED